MERDGLLWDQNPWVILQPQPWPLSYLLHIQCTVPAVSFLLQTQAFLQGVTIHLLKEILQVTQHVTHIVKWNINNQPSFHAAVGDKRQGDGKDAESC